MERINALFFYQLGALLKPLTTMELSTSTRVEIWLAAREVDFIVRPLLEFYAALTVCRRTGVELINTIAQVEE